MQRVDAPVALDDPWFSFIPSMGGGPFVMKHGRVMQRGPVLAIWLSGDTDPGCDGVGKGRTYFTFNVPAGPGGRFYTGSWFGPLSPGGGDRNASGAGFSSAYVVVSIDPFELAPNARIRGRVRSAFIGNGRFEAIVCGGIKTDALHPLPAPAPGTPFAGTMGGAQFTVGSALAIAQKQSDTSLIATVELFADRKVTCATRKHTTSAVVRISDIGGTSNLIALAGTPQPASMHFRIGKEMRYPLDDSSAWIQLDRLAYATGERITGRAVVATNPAIKPQDAATLGGTFEAVVCAE